MLEVAFRENDRLQARIAADVCGAAPAAAGKVAVPQTAKAAAAEALAVPTPRREIDEPEMEPHRRNWDDMEDIKARA